MAVYTFDGTTNITAMKSDTVFIDADLQTFTQASDNGSNVNLAFGAASITITGTTLSSGNLPNVFVAGGTFSYAGSSNANGSGSGNVLGLLINGTYNAPVGTDDDNQIVVFGGLGRVDSIDGAESITVGGKGSILVFGNGGADSISQSAAFDDDSFVNINGDSGNDTINLSLDNDGATIFVGGGAGTDSITINNSDGSTTIYGGLDSTDGADTISFNSEGGPSGTAVIYGNGGDDIIRVGTVGSGTDAGDDAIDSTSVLTVYGGVGNDTILVAGSQATISVLGNEGADSIRVENTGTTYITGGNQTGDQSLDGNDTITFLGSGKVLIYGNVGADSITLNLAGAETSEVSVYGGKDADTIVVDGDEAEGLANVFIAGGEGSDIIRAEGNGGATTVYGGVSAADSADAADNIRYSGAGTANIFGNGGDDVIGIRRLGTVEGTNDAVVVVSGGGGNDSINVERPQFNGDQRLQLAGNEGNDIFSIVHARTANGVTTVGNGQNIEITDFAPGGDKLALAGLLGTSPGTLQITAGNFQTLQQALDAASRASGATATQNKAAAVVFNGSTYVVIESGAASSGFSAAADQSIKLTGVTDLVGVVGSTTITGIAQPI